MKVLLKNESALFAVEVVEASAKDEDFFDCSLPENTNILSLISAQTDKESEEDHVNFEIFCKSKEQAENFVKTLYSDGFLDLTEYEKYTYANIDEDFDENDFEKIENIAKNKNISQQLDTEKPDWERENREKYAWEE